MEVQGSGGQLERPLEACLQMVWTCSECVCACVCVCVCVCVRALSRSVTFKPILKQSFVFQVLVVNRN